jgi:NAD(P)H-hydrate epimerase
MSGAVILASLSALKAGCGLVMLGVPEGLNDICESNATEVITRPLPQVKSARTLALRAVGEADRLAAEAAACVLGCGGGRHHETQELFARLVERNETPLVLDADGLYPFGPDPDRLVRHRAPLCITPHAGELARLLRVETEAVQADRIGSALRAARHFDCVCVLKGALTVVATITGQVYLNPTGNSGMGTAGSGDVLAGLIGSLLAQGMSVLGAATAGVFLHGLAGDIAAEMQGERGLVASDIMAELPEALQCVEQGSTHPGY